MVGMIAGVLAKVLVGEGVRVKVEMLVGARVGVCLAALVGEGEMGGGAVVGVAITRGAAQAASRKSSAAINEERRDIF